MNANPIDFGATNSATAEATSAANPISQTTPPPDPIPASSTPSGESEISNLKSEILQPPSISLSAAGHATAAILSVVSERANPNPQSAIAIPQSPMALALAHAERSYPTAHRPACPIRAKLFDYYKQHCIDERLRIERERQNSQPSTSIAPPSSSVPSVVNKTPENAPQAETTFQPQPLNPETPPETEPKQPETKPETPESPETPQSLTPIKSPTVAMADPQSEISNFKSAIHPILPNPPCPSELEALTIDFHERLTNKSPFDSLTPEQQDTLFELLNEGAVAYNQILAFSAQPPPAGFGIVTVKASLTRFRQRYLKRRREELKKENTEHLRDVLLKCTTANVDDAHLPATERMLGIRLLRTTADPDSPIAKIREIAKTLNILRQQSLAERKHNERKR